MINDSRGFSLLEVVASIVIITIILVSISQLILQTNETAVTNNEKLAVIHLADLTIERLKIESYIVEAALPDEESTTWDNWVNNNTCFPIPLNTDPENDLSIFMMNGQEYNITACATPQIEREKALGLVNVRIEVTTPRSKSKGHIEGFVKL